MNYEYIEQLLEKYWQCEATLEEEQILKSFFCQHDIPEHLQKYASVFRYANENLNETLTQEVEVEKVPTFTQRLTPLFKAAAVVAVVLTIGNIAESISRNSVNEQQPATDTYILHDDISAKIQVIDKEQGESIAKSDSTVQTNNITDKVITE